LISFEIKILPKLYNMTNTLLLINLSTMSHAIGIF